MGLEALHRLSSRLNRRNEVPRELLAFYPFVKD